MGNADSTYFKRNFETWIRPDVVPERHGLPKHDPQEGFQTDRKQRSSILTEEEMYLARIPPHKRDYCAHLLLDHTLCKQREFPFMWRCEHQKHTLANCEYNDFFMRMKEYERERRLNLRDEKRKQTEEQVIS